jgi:hypothetical protein
MTIPKFTEEYVPQLKSPTVRNNIKKEHLNLTRLGALIREKQVGAYSVSITNPSLLRNFLFIMKTDVPTPLKQFIKDLELKDSEKAISTFIKQNQDTLIKSKIINENNDIVKVPKFLHAYFEDAEQSK